MSNPPSTPSVRDGAAGPEPESPSGATRFSEQVREASWGAHEGAERSAVMTALFEGELPIEGYGSLLFQYRAVYGALEDTSGPWGSDEVARRFWFPEVHRLAAVEADLDRLAAPGWRDRLTTIPATDRYVARLHELQARWPAGMVAQQYVRYLGDLSGGFFIGRTVRAAFDLREEGDGADFYRFPAIADPKAFKEGYRVLLDEAPWAADERERFVAEVLAGFAFNTAMLMELPIGAVLP